MKIMLAALAAAFVLVTPGMAQSNPSLAAHARHVALHGGILCTRHGCSTPLMKTLMEQVYRARFAAAGAGAQRMAVCVMQAESGGNPGAISSSDDYGGSQLNWLAHHREHPEWYRPGRGFRYLAFDPWYAASQMWAMSKAGHDWTPWTTRFGCY